MRCSCTEKRKNVIQTRRDFMFINTRVYNASKHMPCQNDDDGRLWKCMIVTGWKFEGGSESVWKNGDVTCKRVDFQSKEGKQRQRSRMEYQRNGTCNKKVDHVVFAKTKPNRGTHAIQMREKWREICFHNNNSPNFKKTAHMVFKFASLFTIQRFKPPWKSSLIYQTNAEVS